MLHSQGLSNNPYPEPKQPNYPHLYLSLQDSFLILIPISLKSSLILSSHLHLGLPNGLFPVGVTMSMAYGTDRKSVV